MNSAAVLIVDDDRVTARLCHRLLERASYQVVTAVDPLEALQILEHQKVDLLLSDIRMPIMDGFQLIERAKQLQPELPVLVMTGYGSVEYAIQALHRGVEGLILKPFESSAELVQAVQRVLDESRQRREAARLQALRPLFDVTERLLSETSPQALETLILSAIVGLFQAVYAGIYHLDNQNRSLKTIRSAQNQSSLFNYVMADSALMDRLIEGAPTIINANGPSAFVAVQGLLKEGNLEGILFASVRRNATQFVFCACRETGKPPFAEADQEMFVILARQAVVAMENARLYSDLKDYVRRVEESQRRLVQAEKMAAVGRMMATLAHEINNPLQSVRNCLHLASRKGVEEASRQHYLNLTDIELERLVTTVRRMLDFYRPGTIDKVPTDIIPVIDHVTEMLAAQFSQQGIHLTTSVYGTPRPIEVVADQFQQVIFNMLLNAQDAFDEPHAPSQEKNIWIDIFFDDDQLRITIEDSGPGIPPELQERIFEPFLSTKQHGTGLGLSVSYDIMEKHQGRLSIASPRHGSGACFEIILPIGVDTQDG